MTTQVANEVGIACTCSVYVWVEEGGGKNCCRSPTQVLSGFGSPFCCFYQLTQNEWNPFQNTFKNYNFQVGKNSASLFLDCITETLQGNQPDSCRCFI